MMGWLVKRLFRDAAKKIEALEMALERATMIGESSDSEIQQLHRELEMSRTKRIAAETLATERRAEVDRLVEDLKQTREQMASVIDARMKSLDALNVNLMTRQTPETPDLEKWKALRGAVANVAQKAMSTDRAMDMALLGKFHPAFKAKVTEFANLSKKEEQ